MKNRLIAIASGRIMGEIRYEGGRLDFHYAPSWSDDASAFPMSLSMPLVVQEHGHSKVEAFLWGLLPDNEVVLQRWGQKFRVSPRNPFRLIENVGEDCAGAIQFAKPDRVEHLLGPSQKPTVHWISNRELDERIALLASDAAATRLGGDNGQFSLAGAQPKLALYRDRDSGRWGVPEGRTPTTHILKPSTGAFDGQTENEHFCLQLAAELGFVAANSSVCICGGLPVIVVERYDRLAKGSSIQRIHQEDMGQALAVRPQKKSKPRRAVAKSDCGINPVPLGQSRRGCLALRRQFDFELAHGGHGWTCKKLFLSPRRGRAGPVGAALRFGKFTALSTANPTAHGHTRDENRVGIQLVAHRQKRVGILRP